MAIRVLLSTRLGERRWTQASLSRASGNMIKQLREAAESLAIGAKITSGEQQGNKNQP